MPSVTTHEGPGPAFASAGFGRLRCAVLDSLLFDLPVSIPAVVHDEILGWAQEMIGDATGGPIGFRLGSVPADWMEILRWAGGPVSQDGPLEWAALVDYDPAGAAHMEGRRLVVPPPEVFSQLSGVGVKPLRMLVHAHLGCRLQATTGLHFYLWANQALLVSQVDFPAGGFLHGPDPGRRFSLAITPGHAQLLRF